MKAMLLVALCGVATASALVSRQPHGRSSSSAGGKSLSYTLPNDFAKLNPRNPQAEWVWAKANNDEFTAPSVMVSRTHDGVDFDSIPFQAYLPADNTHLPPLWIQYESLMLNKQEFKVEAGQKLTLNAKFTCQTIKERSSDYAQSASANPSDDPSLITCGVGLATNDESALIFSVVATNKGVWSIYERNRFSLFEHPERKQKEFTIYHRLADRKSADEVINATITYDRSAGKVDFLLNDQVVYTIGELGTLNQVVKDEPAYADVYTVDRPDLVKSEPEQFQAVIYLAELPDTIDPNNPSNPPLRGTRLTRAQDYYDPKAKFVDEKGVKKYTIWGQGAVMGLKSVEVMLQK